MDFLSALNYIKTDEELKKIISKKIKILEEESKEYNNTDILGFRVSHNANNFHLLESDADISINIDMRWMYDGYIPKNTKIIYGLYSDNTGMITNNGMFYTIDDDSYIFDFCKYIKDKNVSLEEDLFEYILIFMSNYFGSLKSINRDDMFKMILRSDKECFDTTLEHKLSDFKGKGNAMCTEYSIMANNILNVFGINSSVIIGQMKKSNDEIEGHAFNFINFNDREKEEEVNALIDFSNPVDVYSADYKKLGKSPYIMYLDDLSVVIEGLLRDDLHLVFKEYDIMILGKSLLQLFTDREREYFSCSQLVVKSKTNTNKKTINMI